jgi:hypothetical protein
MIPTPLPTVCLQEREKSIYQQSGKCSIGLSILKRLNMITKAITDMFPDRSAEKQEEESAKIIPLPRYENVTFPPGQPVNRTAQRPEGGELSWRLSD